LRENKTNYVVHRSLDESKNRQAKIRIIV